MPKDFISPWSSSQYRPKQMLKGSVKCPRELLWSHSSLWERGNKNVYDRRRKRPLKQSGMLRYVNLVEGHTSTQSLCCLQDQSYHSNGRLFFLRRDGRALNHNTLLDIQNFTTCIQSWPGFFSISEADFH